MKHNFNSRFLYSKHQPMTEKSLMGRACRSMSRGFSREVNVSSSFELSVISFLNVEDNIDFNRNTNGISYGLPGVGVIHSWG